MYRGKHDASCNNWLFPWNVPQLYDLRPAERIIPSAEQTTVLRGTADVNDGVRVVSGKTDATGHGSITLLPCSVSKRHVLFTHGKLIKSRKFCLSSMVKVMGKQHML